MKKKIVLMLITTIIMSLLSGCGQNSSKLTDSTIDVSNEDKKSKIQISDILDEENESNASVSEVLEGNKQNYTISEVLNNENIILYKVSEMDKEDTPSSVYFFEKGKFTEFSGSDLGLTLGELSKMKDDEIWSLYRNIRESYKSKYKEMVEESRKEKIDMFERVIDVAVKDNGTSDKYSYTIENMENEKTNFNYSELKERVNEIKEYDIKGPFYDIPFSINLKTDSSGNYVEFEQIGYPIQYEDMLNASLKQRFEFIQFDNTAEGGEVQIYDTVYNCFPLTKSMTMCTRAPMIIDNVDSENVHIDLTFDEIEALPYDLN